MIDSKLVPPLVLEILLRDSSCSRPSRGVRPPLRWLIGGSADLEAGTGDELTIAECWLPISQNMCDLNSLARGLVGCAPLHRSLSCLVPASLFARRVGSPATESCAVAD
jgi:hypothetical protein